MTSIGNDIVDLKDSDSDLSSFHADFKYRILNSQELFDIKNNDLPNNLLLWIYWASKESAYKYMSRIYPEIHFSWKHFYFNYQLKKIFYKKYHCDCKIDIQKNKYIHVISYPNGSNLKSIFSKVYYFPNLAYQNVKYSSLVLKDLFTNHIASFLKVSSKDIQIKKNHSGYHVPYVYAKNKILENPVSFSHHGSYISYVFSHNMAHNMVGS